MKKVKALLMILVIASLFIPVHSVHADMAPPPAPQLGGLQPFQYQTTNVQMVYERVEMELEPFISLEDDYSRPESRVNVTAYFTMHNQGASPESMQAIFPLESFTNCMMGYGGGNSYTYYSIPVESFDVEVNGNQVAVQKVVTDHPYKNTEGFENSCTTMSWAGFYVTFPVDEDVVVRVHYVMESLSIDSMQNIEYILETGAGWAGPIKRGYVVFKFPYEATAENVLAESTPGYQFLYNEIFWSFENLEPTKENNIQVSIVSPDTWQGIISLRRELKANSALPEQWLQLAQIYENISTWHGTNLRSEYYYQKIAATYEQGIESNPNNASLYAFYAQFVRDDCCFYTGNKIDLTNLNRITGLISKALALEQTNPLALEVLGFVESQNPDFAFTPPPTIPPTVTSLFTATASITPSPTITPTATETPNVVTIIQTKLVYAPTITPKPAEATATISPTNIISQNENQNGTGASTMVFSALIIFALGTGAGIFWSKRKVSP